MKNYQNRKSAKESTKEDKNRSEHENKYKRGKIKFLKEYDSYEQTGLTETFENQKNELSSNFMIKKQTTLKKNRNF